MKKIAFILAVLLLVAGTAGAEPFFRDMEGHWAAPVVHSLAQRGIIGGYPDGTYRPSKQVTRGEFVKLLVSAIGLEITDWSAENHWSMPYVTAGVAGGVVIADEYVGKIDPTAPIPREEVAAMLVRAQGLRGQDRPLTFSDADKVSELYQKFIATAVEQKLLAGYPDGSFQPQGTLTRAEAAAVISRILDQRAVAPLRLGLNKRNIHMQTQRIPVNVVKLEKGRVSPRVVFANNQMQGLESIEALAGRSGAVAAITGSFFDHIGTREPWGNIITGGLVAHVGDVGTTAGFLPDGRMLLDRMRVRIEGSTGSFPGVWDGVTWRAWGFNRSPGSAGGIFIYTPVRGERLGFASGTSVVVQDGRVTGIFDNLNVIIPSDGYVINFSGHDRFRANLFYIGQYVSYNVRIECDKGLELSEWYNVVEGVAAGPTLIRSGQITANSAAERVNVAAAQKRTRAAIGVTADGHYLLVTTTATINELARILKSFDVIDALNMDGGGSAALWFQGETVTRPLRQLNNAIVFSIR